MQLPTQTQALIHEFEAVLPSDRDVKRATFTILALCRGWQQARIARYLGISRARVGQKIDQYNDYGDQRKAKMPVLVENLRQTEKQRRSMPEQPLIQFTLADWNDQEFVQSMLLLVSSK